MTGLHMAFLGCGNITRRHAKTLAKVRPDVRLSFASREKMKAERYRGELRGGEAYSGYEAALRDESVDAIFIALPPAMHFDWAKKALSADKHVIVEKPPFLSAFALDEVAQLAKEKDRRLLVAENYYYKPITKKIRSLLEARAIGDVLFLHVNAIKRQSVSDWRTKEGALLEGGIHWINFMNNIGLTVRRAEGFLPPTAEDGPDRSAMVSFEYEEGAVGSLYYSWEVPSPLQGIRISRIYGRDGVITFESNGAFVFVQGKSPSLSIAPGLSDAGGFAAMFDDFVRALRENVEPAMSLDKARKDLDLVEQIIHEQATAASSVEADGEPLKGTRRAV